MKITAGEYEVLESGTVISFGIEPLTFHLAPDLIIRFVFLKDDLASENTVQYLAIDKATLEMRLVNFNSTLDTGTKEPIRIGYLNGRNLYLNFRTRTTDMRFSRTIDYTWYLGETFTANVQEVAQNG